MSYIYLVHAESLLTDEFVELLSSLKGAAHLAVPMVESRTIRVTLAHNQTLESLFPYCPLLNVCDIEPYTQS